MTSHEDKRISHDDNFSKRGGYISQDDEMTIPAVPEGPGPGSEPSEASGEQSGTDED